MAKYWCSVMRVVKGVCQASVYFQALKGVASTEVSQVSSCMSSTVVEVCGYVPTSGVWQASVSVAVFPV